MKKIKFISLLCVFLLYPTLSHPLVVSANIILRVFLLKYNNEFCSGFTLEVDNKQYLITAKHLFDGIKENEKINIFYKDKWHPINVKPIYCEPKEVDIIVFALPQQISQTYSLIPSLDSIFISQDVYFLGFPYGLYSSMGEESGFPIPFVKRGILSALKRHSKGFAIIYVDGHNNPGFSGGPIVFKDLNTNDLKVAGVVVGYRHDREKVIALDEETNLHVKSNTGILIGFGIQNAIDAIKKNPIGFPINN